MSMQLRSLVDDFSRYLQAFNLFLERSSEHQTMREFIHGTIPQILTSIGGGRTTLNVMGVGSGAGEIDLELLAQLHAAHPEAKVENEVVEPSDDMVYKYKVLVSKTPGIDHISFKWNKMTALDFESHWRERNTHKKMDFIHMIQMLYYVKDPEATISFYRSLLDKDGKLLILLVSGESGWGRLWKTYKTQICKCDITQCITTGDVKSFLDAEGIPYESYSLPSQMDITECFTDGDEKGELLLDFLTEVMDFSKSASPDLKNGVLELLKHPDCSTELDGKIIFNNNLEAIVLQS